MPPTKVATAVTVVKNMGTVGSQLWNVVRRWLGSGCAIGCGDILPIAYSTSLAALSPASTAPSMEPTSIIFTLGTEYTYITLTGIGKTNWLGCNFFTSFLCVDEITLCDHSNESYWAVISHETFCFVFFILEKKKKKRKIIQTPITTFQKGKF